MPTDAERELRDGHRVIDCSAGSGWMILDAHDHLIARRSNYSQLTQLLAQLRRAYRAGHIAAQVEEIHDLGKEARSA